jgi:hypothetical protein
MWNRAWVEELLEAAKEVWAALRSFWIQDVWPVLMTVWIFFVFAAPLIIVILVLWYLDKTGWRAGDGFYTIGAAVLGPTATLIG